jgi:tetratricopeptide (TPR) repeat protein
MAMRPIHRAFRVACIIASALTIGGTFATAQTPTSDTVSAEDLVELGWKHLDPGPEHDLVRAIELFHAALAAELDHVPALVGLSNAYRLRVPWDRGDRSGLGAAVAFGLKATYLAPDDPDAHKALGRAYLFQRWYRQALHHFQRQQDLRPDADAAFRLGWMGIEMGDYAAAWYWFERSYTLDPTNTWMPLYIGVTERTLGNHERAEEMLRRGLEHHPDNRYLIFNIVLSLVQRGAGDAAVEYGEALVQRDPENVDHLLAAGMANWYARRDSTAVAFFEQAMQKAGGEDPTIGWWMTYASTALGDLYTRQGRHAEAEAMLDRSEAAFLDRNREAGEGWGYMYDLARVYATRGDRQGALGWMRKAVRFGFPEVYLAKVDPMIAALGGDPEYDRLLTEVEERIRAMRESVDERR